jgi:hypothetical protein
MKMYTIRDQVAGFFIAPFTAPNDNVAKRMFISSLGDSFPHRRDYSLHSIGAFDTDSGVLSPVEPYLVLAGLSVGEDLDPRVHFPSAPSQE